MVKLEVIMLRHGESKGNRDKICQGGVYDGSPLTKQGQYQAVRTGQAFLDAKVIFDRAIVSPLIRTKKTAKLVLGHSGNNVEIEYNNALRERFLGFLEGKSFEKERLGKLTTKYSMDEQYVNDEIWIPEFEGVEPIRDMIARTSPIATSLLYHSANLERDQRFLIVGSGWNLSGLMNNILEENPKLHHLDNAHYNKVVFVDGKLDDLKANQGPEETKVFYIPSPVLVTNEARN